MTKTATVTLNPAIDKNCAVDQVVAERKLRCSDPVSHPGGGGINVARVINRLGESASAYWTKGGHTGELLHQLLDQQGLEHHPIPIRATTRENLIVYEKSSDQQYRFGMPGAKLEEQELQSCIEQLQAITPEYLIFSGSLPPGIDAERFQRIAAAASDSARIVLDISGKQLKPILDTSLRPFLIKPNIRELEELAGISIENDAEIYREAKRLIENQQAEVVVTSLGSGGVVLVTAEEHAYLRAPTVKIRSKVGAGDSTVGGIIVGLLRGYPLKKAVLLGVAAGSAAVMTGGTELCRREDTERLFEQMNHR